MRKVRKQVLFVSSARPHSLMSVLGPIAFSGLQNPPLQKVRKLDIGKCFYVILLQVHVL